MLAVYGVYVTCSDGTVIVNQLIYIFVYLKSVLFQSTVYLHLCV
jgi:hypothetical protein